MRAVTLSSPLFSIVKSTLAQSSSSFVWEASLRRAPSSLIPSRPTIRATLLSSSARTATVTSHSLSNPLSNSTGASTMTARIPEASSADIRALTSPRIYLCVIEFSNASFELSVKTASARTFLSRELSADTICFPNAAQSSAVHGRMTSSAAVMSR